MASMRVPFSFLHFAMMALIWVVASGDVNGVPKERERQLQLPLQWSVFENGRFAVHDLGGKSAQLISENEIKENEIVHTCLTSNMKKRSEPGPLCQGGASDDGGHYTWYVLPTTSKTEPLDKGQDVILLKQLHQRVSEGQASDASQIGAPSWIQNWQNGFEAQGRKPQHQQTGNRAIFVSDLNSILHVYDLNDNGLQIILPGEWVKRDTIMGLLLSHPQLPQIKVKLRMLKGVHKKAAEQFLRQPIQMGEEKYTHVGSVEFGQGTRELNVVEHLQTTDDQPAQMWTVMTSVKGGTVVAHMIGPPDAMPSIKYLIWLFSEQRIVQGSSWIETEQTRKDNQQDHEESKRLGSTNSQIWTSSGSKERLEEKRSERNKNLSAWQAGFEAYPYLSEMIFCPNGKMVWRSNDVRIMQFRQRHKKRKVKSSIRQGRWSLVLNSGQYMLHIQLGHQNNYFVPIPQMRRPGVVPGRILESLIQFEDDEKCEVQ